MDFIDVVKVPELRRSIKVKAGIGYLILIHSTGIPAPFFISFHFASLFSEEKDEAFASSS
jgi:hypothetical protein